MMPWANPAAARAAGWNDDGPARSGGKPVDAEEAIGAARDWRPVVGAAVVALLLAVFGGVSPYARPVVLAGPTESIYWLAAALIGA